MSPTARAHARRFDVPERYNALRWLAQNDPDDRTSSTLFHARWPNVTAHH